MLHNVFKCEYAGAQQHGIPDLAGVLKGAGVHNQVVVHVRHQMALQHAARHIQKERPPFGDLVREDDRLRVEHVDDAHRAEGEVADGSFVGGKTSVLDVTTEGVQIAMENARFKTFAQADYDAIYKKLVAGEIEIVKDVDADGNEVAITDIPVSIVKVTVVG